MLLTDVGSGADPVVLNAPAAVSDLEYSHRGDLLAAALGDGTVRVLDAATGQEKASIRAGAVGGTAATFSPDDTMLATGDAEGRCRCGAVGPHTTERHAERRPSLATGFQPIRTTHGAGHRRTRPHLGHESGASVTTIRCPPWLYVARFSPDGKRVAAGGLDGAVHLFGEDGGSARTLRGHNGTVFDVDFDRQERPGQRGSRRIAAHLGGGR